MVKGTLNGVIVRNQLTRQIENVQVVFAHSKKSTSWWAYATDWRTVDIETGDYIFGKYEVDVGNLENGGHRTVDKHLPFDDDERGYWQVYFRIGAVKYSIDKNNAQCNPWADDSGKYVEITLREELPSKAIRVDFVLPSGNAYFYCHQRS